jgi:uncharacterized protein (TIGR02145 family)
VPTKGDVDDLLAFLGGDILTEGGKLKEIGLVHWNTPNGGATDYYGFRGVGSGQREYSTGQFISLKIYGEHWLSTVYLPTKSWMLELSKSSGVFRVDSLNKKYGMIVRCMRDI